MIIPGTIAAVATPPGEGGIAVIRISGGDAAAIGARLFRGRLRDRRTVFGHVADPATGEIIDEAIGILMCAPRTYTREDTVELQVHGGTVCVQRILELSLREGARLAEPGEFTLRAFLNGRLDLAQAESVLDVIRARTEASLRLAVQGLGGRLSAEIRQIRARALDLLAYLGARADFPDEDVPAEAIGCRVNALIDELETLISSADRGMLYRQGMRVALVGSPNAGKSSLLNRLLREDRAIVTPIAGTTRDTVEESISLDGIPVVLIDTAGLSESDDPVERIGVARAWTAIERSDALLVILDRTRQRSSAEDELLEQTWGRPRLVVLNKADLPTHPGAEPPDVDIISVSALTGQGIGALEQQLTRLINAGGAISPETVVVTNPRHKAAMARALAHLQQMRSCLDQHFPEDLASVDLQAAIAALGEITGEAVTEDLLDAIFRNFCIGK